MMAQRDTNGMPIIGGPRPKNAFGLVIELNDETIKQIREQLPETDEEISAEFLIA